MFRSFYLYDLEHDYYNDSYNDNNSMIDICKFAMYKFYGILQIYDKTPIFATVQNCYQMHRSNLCKLRVS